jgi:glutaredoxin 3
MPTVEIYTTPFCPYCVRAKRLLSRKGVEFIEIDLWQFPARRDEMIARADGRRTVPQVFVDGRGLGGSDDLQTLEATGGLDPLLGNGAVGPVSG